MEGANGAFRRNKCKNCVRLWNKLPKEERDRIKLEQKNSILTRIEKICPVCKKLKPKVDFYKSTLNLDGMSIECRECNDHRTLHYRNKLRDISVQKDKPIITKQVCRVCKQQKNITQFSKNVAIKSGYDTMCKCCSKQYWRDNCTDISRTTWLLGRIKSKCNKLDIPFDLELTDLIIPKVCPILGIPLVFGLTGKENTNNSPSVDRIDPNGGYVKNNIVIISGRANRIKYNATIDELDKIVQFYKSLLLKYPRI